MRALAVLSLLAGMPLLSPAVTGFEPAAAIAWADGTVQTDVPKEDRIYVLGPETRNEDFPPRPVTARRIVSAKKAHALGDLGLNRFGKMPVTITVYPAAAGSVGFTTGDGKSDYPLRAGDVVVVRFGP